MTYCIGMLLDEGVVLLADSRTNAGVDQISTFRKMTIFEKAGERAIVLLSSGNLAITQSLISMLQESIRANGERPSLMNVPNLFEAARQSLGKRPPAREPRLFEMAEYVDEGN